MRSSWNVFFVDESTLMISSLNIDPHVASENQITLISLWRNIRGSTIFYQRVSANPNMYQVRIQAAVSSHICSDRSWWDNSGNIPMVHVLQLLFDFIKPLIWNYKTAFNKNPISSNLNSEMKATKYNRCAFVQICFAIVCGYRRCIIKWKTNKRFFFISRPLCIRL